MGTGRLNKKADSSLPLSQRKYDTTKYIVDGQVYETPFVAAALTAHYNVDKVYMIGTVHSMWEEVYSCYSQLKGKEIDEDLYLELGEYCESANHNSDLFVPHKEAIENVLGRDSKVILINYGLNQEEIQSNTEIILKINDLLNSGDELIVDVSHSFRSLPIMIMNLLVYLKEVSRKSIKLEHIHYGMLEVKSELGYAPIVDLAGVLEVNDWITSAVSFQEFGNVHKMAELLRTSEPVLAERLDKFSNILSLNHLNAAAEQLRHLEAKTEIQSPFARLIVEPILTDFVKEFKSCDDPHFQFKLAKWQFNHKNYLSSYASLVESCVTLVCSIEEYDWTIMQKREEAKEIIRGKVKGKIDYSALKKEFKRINNIRNALIHCNTINTSVKDMIKILRESINKLEPWFK